MFTGIIVSLGEVRELKVRDGDWALVINSDKLDFSDVKPGDSIAVNGVCLTVTKLHPAGFDADVSNETMELTTFRELKRGSAVNLEKALTPSSRLGGHIVSGHVDGVGELLSLQQDGKSIRMDYRVPPQLAKYIAHKGSICIDGTSLTVNSVCGADFSINIIPHTQEQTIIHSYTVGTRVNLEVDLISRYLERLLLGDEAAIKGASGVKNNSMSAAHTLSKELLAKHGFDT